jgi:hypothetical protein
MYISEQAILFFNIMIFYILINSSSYLNETFLYKLISVFVITLCIQYLTMTNLPLISWVFVFIPIFYILSIIIIEYLIINK